MPLCNQHIPCCIFEKQGLSHQPLPQSNEWGLGEWIDPNLSFEELYELSHQEILKLNMEAEDNEEASKFLLLERLFGRRVCVIPNIYPAADEEGTPKSEGNVAVLALELAVVVEAGTETDDTTELNDHAVGGGPLRRRLD